MTAIADEEGRRVPIVTPFPACRLDAAERYEIIARLRRIYDAARELGEAEEDQARAAIEHCVVIALKAIGEIQDAYPRQGEFEDELVAIDTLVRVLDAVDLRKLPNDENGMLWSYVGQICRQVARAVNALDRYDVDQPTPAGGSYLTADTGTRDTIQNCRRLLHLLEQVDRTDGGADLDLAEHQLLQQLDDALAGLQEQVR